MAGEDVACTFFCLERSSPADDPVPFLLNTPHTARHHYISRSHGMQWSSPPLSSVNHVCSQRIRHAHMIARTPQAPRV
eukprot:675143-Pelagomonas_calceolata.AAC.1